MMIINTPKNSILLVLLHAFLLSASSGQAILTTPNDSSRALGESQTYAKGDAVPHTDREREFQAPDEAPDFSPSQLSSSSAGSSVAGWKKAGPLTTKSEFENFAEAATGQRLPVFGRQLFEDVPTTFAPLEHIPVPADYVIGPGDELLIRAWGKIDLDARVTLDRNGQIYLPKIGIVHVAGLRSAQVEGYLRAAIGTLFKDFDLNVSLGKLRSIQIFVLGHARQPGVYTIGSLSTLVNAIFASGGPSATGSMRRIQLLRDNKLIAAFDLYALAQRGDMSRDLQLLPGDVIYIPSVGAQVAMSGDVSIPGIYETNGPAKLSDLLESAGGVTNLARTARVSLERIDAHDGRRLEEFPLDAMGMQTLLADGDVLRIFPLSPKFQNAVTLRGSVAQPGRYAWAAGMKISNLLPTRDSIITRNYWNQQNQLISVSPDRPFGNTELPESSGSRDTSQQREGNAAPGIASGKGIERPEQETMKSRTDGPETAAADLQGVSQRPHRSSPDSSTVLTNDGPHSMIATIGQNSAEVNWNYAVIERLDEHDLSTRLIPFCLSRAIDDPGSSDNQTLHAGDVITIFSRSDLELPIEEHASFVRVGGEVNAPGMYRVEPGEGLREVVKQAGGLTSHSYLYAAFFSRVSTRLVEEEQLRQSTDQMQRELAARFANATPAAGQSGADQQAQMAIQQASLTKLASSRPTGRIVLEMKSNAVAIEDIPDLPLEDGDILYIPPRLSTIQVTGAVYNANAFRHQPGRPLITYLDAAGGVTREADQKRTFVIRADGTVISRQSRIRSVPGGFEHLVLLPGDAIVVPERVKVSSKMETLLQATQFMSQSAITAASLSVIK